MVKYKEEQQAEELDFIFMSLSDPIRRSILKRVAQSPLAVSEIASSYAISLPAVSKHLRILERARLISRHKSGRKRIVVLNPAALKTAAEHVAYYQKFWNERLDALADYLEGGERHD